MSLSYKYFCLSLVVLFLSFASSLSAQKYGCVNTDYIMTNVPDYVQAQQRLDKIVAEWQKEIEGKMQELETLQQSYQQEAYLLPDNLKNRRLQEIKTRNEEIHNLQRQRFAAGGDLDKKRSELLKPLQDRIYSAIERIAKEKGYAFILDKAGAATVLYASDKYDISNEVLESLGYKASAPAEQPSNSKKSK